LNTGTENQYTDNSSKLSYYLVPFCTQTALTGRYIHQLHEITAKYVCLFGST